MDFIHAARLCRNHPRGPEAAAPAGQPPAFSSVQAAVWVPSPRARARQGDVVMEARAHAVDQRPCSPGLGVRGGPARCPKPDFPRRTGQPAREGRRCVSRRFPGPSGPGCQVSVFTALIRLNWPCAGGLHLRTQAADDGLVDGEFWPPRRPLQHLAVLDDSIPEVFIELQKTCTHIDNNRKVSLDTTRAHAAARGRFRQNTGRSPLSLSTVPPVALATPVIPPDTASNWPPGLECQVSPSTAGSGRAVPRWGAPTLSAPHPTLQSPPRARPGP